MSISDISCKIIKKCNRLLISISLYREIYISEVCCYFFWLRIFPDASVGLFVVAFLLVYVFLCLFLVERTNFLQGVIHENVGSYRVSGRMLVTPLNNGFTLKMLPIMNLHLFLQRREGSPR